MTSSGMDSDPTETSISVLIPAVDRATLEIFENFLPADEWLGVKESGRGGFHVSWRLVVKDTRWDLADMVRDILRALETSGVLEQMQQLDEEKPSYLLVSRRAPGDDGLYLDIDLMRKLADARLDLSVDLYRS